MCPHQKSSWKRLDFCYTERVWTKKAFSIPSKRESDFPTNISREIIRLYGETSDLAA